jgi:anti-anti-sigma factor
MSEAHLSIDVDHTKVDDGIVVARLKGEIDPTSAQTLLHEMQAVIFTAAPAELVLDFSQVGFMDSSGIRTIIELSNQQRARDAKLVLEYVADTARRVLEVTGLTGYLELR